MHSSESLTVSPDNSEAWLVIQSMPLPFPTRFYANYSTPGRQKTWGPASQPGVVLNFVDSNRFKFLSAVVKPVQCTSFVSQVCCRTTSFQICSYLQLFTFQPGMFLNYLETLAWPFFGDRFFGAQEYCRSPE